MDSMNLRQNFDATLYYKERLENLQGNTINNQLRKFALKSCYNVFNRLANTTGRVLDLGCGPTVYGAFAASQYSDEIYLADYLPQNVEQIQKYLRNEADALNHTEIMQLAASLEGNADQWKIIEARVRKSIKGIGRCDITEDAVFMDEHMPRSYDTILSICMLEPACQTLEEYASALKRIYGLLHHGGCFLMVRWASQSTNTYTVGDQVYSTLKITEDQVRTSLKEAGFDLTDCIEESLSVSSEVTYPVKAYVLRKK